MNLAGHEYSERELLRRSMKNWHTPKTKWSGVPRWAKAEEVFCVGSTVAYALCEEFGFDPEEKVLK